MTAADTLALIRLGSTVGWIREQIAECEAFEHRAALNGASAHTAATQRRTLEAVLAKLEGRS